MAVGGLLGWGVFDGAISTHVDVVFNVEDSIGRFVCLVDAFKPKFAAK